MTNNKAESVLAFSSKAVVSKVGDENIKFYPISLRVAFSLQGLAKPLARALTLLMMPTRNDAGLITEEYADKDGGVVSKTTVQAIDPALAANRAKERAEAVDQITTALLDPSNRDLIATLILDSMTKPSERPRGDYSPEQVDHIGSTLDLGTTIQCFQGVIKANASVFGPLGEKIARAVNEATVRALNPATGAFDSTSTTETATDGSSSKTL